MKLNFCVIAFFITSAYLQASQDNNCNNAAFLRTYTGMGYIQSGAKLRIASDEYTKAKQRSFAVITTKKQTEEAQKLEAEALYINSLIDRDQELSKSNITKQVLRSVIHNLQVRLPKNAESKKAEDQEFTAILKQADESLNKVMYWIFNPSSAAHIEKQKKILRDTIHSRLQEIQKEERNSLVAVDDTQYDFSAYKTSIGADEYYPPSAPIDVEHS